MDVLEVILGFIIGFAVENACFELTHHYYCYKNKGDCNKCNDWSCPRQHQLYKKSKNRNRL